jgi:hypothetical protein
MAEYTTSETAARIGIDNTPKEILVINNLKRMAAVMEEIRVILGKNKIVVSSGYRCAELNAAIGSRHTSAHVQGLATDFICPGYGVPYDVCKALEPHIEKLGIDQLIYEFRRWVHIGLRMDGPRHQVITINEKGTSAGIVL